MTEHTAALTAWVSGLSVLSALCAGLAMIALVHGRIRRATRMGAVCVTCLLLLGAAATGQGQLSGVAAGLPA